MAHNATNLEHHEASVPRELLEVNIDPTMKLKLRSKAKPDTSINDCLNILEKVYLLKYPAWYRRYEYFVEDWWARKSQLEEYCNLADIKPEDLRILELIRGVRSAGLQAEFLKDGTKHNEDEAAAPTVDRLLRIARSKQTSLMVENSFSNPSAKKVSDYKQNQKEKWNQSQSQNRGRDQSQQPQGCGYCGSKEKHPNGIADCKAKDAVCKKCGKKNHFDVVCRSQYDQNMQGCSPHCG